MLNRRIFIKDAGLLAAGLGLLPSLHSFGEGTVMPGSFILPRSTPEAQGISSAGISRFLEAVKQSKQDFIA